MNELILVESKTAREGFMERVEVLNKVKALATLPNDVHVTVQMTADYYEVSKKTVESVVLEHKRELESDGMQTLRGEPLSLLKKETGLSARVPALTVLPRRAVLRIGMLLKESTVAKQVRTYLLDTEFDSRNQASETDPFEVMKVVGFHVKTWMNLFEQANVPVETKGAVIKAIYEYAGMSLPIEFTATAASPKKLPKNAEDGNWYSCTRIATLVDAYSITKKPHVQLISALIRKLRIGPDEYKIVHDPFAEKKEDVMMYLYRPSVMQKVAKLLDEYNRPTALKLDRVYNIVYLNHITETKFVEAK